MSLSYILFLLSSHLDGELSTLPSNIAQKQFADSK